MDIPLLAQTITTVLVPFLPYLVKAGEKAAETVGEKLTGDAWDGAKALWTKLWPKVEAKPAALEAAKDAAQAPEDQDLQAALRVQVGKLLKDDDEFAKEIEAVLAQMKGTEGSEVSADHGGVAFGDNARDNKVITGGVQGDAVFGDQRKP